MKVPPDAPSLPLPLTQICRTRMKMRIIRLSTVVFVSIVCFYSTVLSAGDQKEIKYKLRRTEQKTFEIDLISPPSDAVAFHSAAKLKKEMAKDKWLILAVSGYSASDLYFIEFAYQAVKASNKNKKEVKL